MNRENIFLSNFWYGEAKYINSEGYIEDDYRIEFIKEHLFNLNKGIKEGSNCFG